MSCLPIPSLELLYTEPFTGSGVVAFLEEHYFGRASDSAAAETYELKTCSDCGLASSGRIGTRKNLMKNPFMSMFLSGANRVAATVRGQVTSAAKRETAKNTKAASQAWADALTPRPPEANKKRKPRKKAP